jgi:signal transduction histidine kinase
MFAGLGAFLGSTDAFADLGPAVIGVLITAIGFMLVFGPWVWRMANDLTEERRSRIRSEERSDISAHLHDSVLQTLALIQRSDDPKRMVTLARAQERELREWLYGRDRLDDADDLRSAIEQMAGRVEQAHDVPVEVVVVGSAPLDDDTRALVLAAGEAMTNAAKHSEAPKVSVYVEAWDREIDAFVSDQGVGFDPDDDANGGRGIIDSIRGRMERHGGSVTITSDSGEGTEVHLHLSRSQS